MISKNYLKQILVFLTPILLGGSTGMSMLYNNSVSDIINYNILSIYLFTVLLYINYKYLNKKTFNLSVVLMILSIVINIIIYFIRNLPKPERFIIGGPTDDEATPPQESAPCEPPAPGAPCTTPGIPCSPACSQHGRCNGETGDCDCDPGWFGEVCNKRVGEEDAWYNRRDAYD